MEPLEHIALLEEIHHWGLSIGFESLYFCSTSLQLGLTVSECKQGCELLGSSSISL